MRETGRRKPRQHHGADSNDCPPESRWAKEPLSLFELDPRGSRRQRGGLGDIKRASYAALKKRGLRWSTESLSLSWDPCLHSEGQLPHKKRTVKKEGVGGVWELQGEGPRAVAKETADSMPRFS